MKRGDIVRDVISINSEFYSLNLFTPGPVRVSPAVKSALLHPEINHREREFSEILNDVRLRIPKIFTQGVGRYEAVVLSGSGTSAVECALSSSLTENDTVLVIKNGAFGERIHEILDLHNIPVISLEKNWGEEIFKEDAESIIYSNSDITAVAMVHHETSTGVLNPLYTVGKICREYELKFIVDATSSAGAEKIDMKKYNITFATTSANKCIGGVAGLSFVCGLRDDFESLSDIPPRNYYLDLYKHYKYETELEQTPYTPAISIFYPLSVALDELFEEGIENRRKRFYNNSLKIREKLKEWQLEFLVAERLMSSSVTSVVVPQGTDVHKLRKNLKDRGYLVYGGKKNLSDKMFQIATMGYIFHEDVDLFLEALHSVLVEMGMI